MNYLFFGYSNCSTCKNAKKWLEKHQVTFDERDIKENPPTKDELRSFSLKTEKPLVSFFNTSGVAYREMNLKEKVKVMTEEEIFECLASNGMLVKRPLLIGNDFVLFGFKEEEWKKQLMS